MVTQDSISDLVIPSKYLEKFFEELILNCPSLAGQIVSRKPEYGSIVDDIVERSAVFKGGKHRQEQGIRYLQMGLVNKFIECFEGSDGYESKVEDYKKLAEFYSKSKEWDYVTPKKLTESALEQIKYSL